MVLSLVYEGGINSPIFHSQACSPLLDTTETITSFFLVLPVDRGTNAQIDNDTIPLSLDFGDPRGPTTPYQQDPWGVANSDLGIGVILPVGSAPLPAIIAG
jgi:hypothetical protein